MKTAFILNPNSGRKNRSKRVETILLDFIKLKQIEAQLVKTKYKGNAREISLELKELGFEKLIVVGGDGTIHEVANAIIGSEIILGIVPIGSGNGLARHLGIPLNSNKALELAFESQPTNIDCGRVGDQYFLNVMGVGIDAQICDAFERSDRGLFSYIKEGLITFIDYKPNYYSISADGFSVSRDLCMISIANSSQYGNSAYIAPNASIADGKLRLVFLNKPSWPRLLLLFYRLFFKTIERAKFVTSMDATTISIRSDNEFTYHLDGEIQSPTSKLEVSIMPACIKVIAKPECPV